MSANGRVLVQGQRDCQSGAIGIVCQSFAALFDTRFPSSISQRVPRFSLFRGCGPWVSKVVSYTCPQGRLYEGSAVGVLVGCFGGIGALEALNLAFLGLVAK